MPSGRCSFGAELGVISRLIGGDVSCGSNTGLFLLSMSFKIPDDRDTSENTKAPPAQIRQFGDS